MVETKKPVVAELSTASLAFLCVSRNTEFRVFPAAAGSTITKFLLLPQSPHLRGDDDDVGSLGSRTAGHVADAGISEGTVVHHAKQRY